MQELLVALGHPMRRDLLRLTSNQPRITVRSASRQLRESQSNVRYHMTSLSQSGLVESVDRKTVKGSTARFWSSTERGEGAIAFLDEIEMREGRQ